MIRFDLRSVVAVMLVALALAGMPPRVHAATLDAVEYYNAALDHYFVTALADEIAKLDAGEVVGWQRTGQHFAVVDPATPALGASPVCRFYGRPEAGLDSHFYSASTAECADVRRRFPGVWLEETSDAFGIWLPDQVTGQCPATTIPVYRAWNGRADSNHRFTTDPAIQQAMIARGYIAEGYGPVAMPVAMCAPGGGGGPGAVPACVVAASSPTPSVGQSIVLTASCTNAPTSFAWTGCASSTSTCDATSASIGQVFYTVVASNPAGAGAPASVGVVWQSVPAPPKCTLSRTAQTDPPVVGRIVVLKATCDAAVGSYSWIGCTSTTRVCAARENSPGPHAYSLIAHNADGSGPPATVTVDWLASDPPPPGLCGQFPSYLYSDVGPESVRVESVLYTPSPGFAWNGAWTVRFVVPLTTDPTRLGTASAVEYAGEPTIRDATISRVACDFRPTDPTGANGPVARSSGTTTINRFTVDPTRTGYPVLQPGGVYYYNLRNWRVSDGTISCPQSPGRCDALVEFSIPH